MRILKYLFFSLSMISLLGCQQMQQQQAQQRKNIALRALSTDMKDCGTDELVTKKDALSRVDCVEKARRKYAYTINYQYMWIVEECAASDRESAVNYVEGRISGKKFMAEFERHWATLTKEDAMQMDNERAQNIQANQQRQQALLAIYGMQQSQQPTYVAPQPYMVPVQQNHSVNTNCNAVGQSIQCNSY